jgi:hypothetical protein
MIKKFENYMSREEMCSTLCRCGYTMSELDECSNHELEEMCRNEEEENNSHNHNMTHESKGDKWIKDAIKKPGSLRKSLNKKEGEKITKGEIDSELQALKSKDKDPKKKGVQGLKGKDLSKFRKLNLAKTLKGLKEHQETQNYMFFGNLQTIKRLVDKMLEMDESEVDAILSNGHNWALDHIATSKDDVEEVFNFLAGRHEHDNEFDNHHSEEGEEMKPQMVKPEDDEPKVQGFSDFNK